MPLQGITNRLKVTHLSRLGIHHIKDTNPNRDIPQCSLDIHQHSQDTKVGHTLQDMGIHL
jgi:hypothetical protein